MPDMPALHPQALRYAERCAGENLIQKILVVVDPTASTHTCLEKAARLAQAYGSSLELFICDVDQDVPGSWAGGTIQAEYRGLLRERRRGQLEELANPLRAKGLHVLTSVEWHVPLEEGIVQHAIRSGADLVVKDTHRHPPMRNAPTIQTDWILIRQVPVPLLLVRPGAWPVHPRIGVAVDPCHPAERPLSLDEAMIGTAGSFGRALTGRIELLHALESPAHLPGDTVSTEARDASFARAKTAVEQLAERNGIGSRAIHCLPGRIPDGIIQLTETLAPDVLVIGAGVRARFQYSAATTASTVLEMSDCDLLVIKPPGFVSPALVTDA
ncbi:MAG TPA: universal stress protein [Steroidobacteraceae bacterium]